MREYFLSVLKKRTPIMIALTIVFLIATVVVNNVSPYVVIEYSDGIFYDAPKDGLFIVYIAGIIALSVVVSLIEFSFKMIRIQSQQAYSFPIKREKLFLARYLIGLIEIVVPITISYCVSSVMICTSYNLYNLTYLWLYLPCALVTAWLCYSYLSFMFCRANNIIDGIAGMALAVLAPLAVGFACETFLNRIQITYGIQINFIKFYYCSPFYILDYSTRFIETKMLDREFVFSWIPFAFFMLWVILSGLTIGLMGFFNKRIKSEDIASDSNSIFTYKMFIGITTVSLTISLSFVISLWAPILGIGLTYLGYFLYQRGTDLGDKILYPLWISLGALVIGVLLVSLQWGGLL